MRAGRLLCVLASIAILFISGSHTLRSQSAHSSPPPAPPVAPVRPVTDDYFGTKVTDPYRYMENLDDPEVQAWMKAQNDYTRAVLARIPGRQQLMTRIRELDQSAPAQVTNAVQLPGDLYFYQKLIAGEDVAKLYMRHGLSGQEKLVADPEKIMLAPSSQSKGKNAIGYYSPSLDARYVAVGIVPGGSENDTEIHVMEIASGSETGDVILRAEDEGDLHWLPDNRSFVYGQQQKLPPGAPVTELRQKYRSFLHTLGTDTDKDRPLFGYGAVPSIKVDPRNGGLVRVEPDSDRALGIINGGTRLNQVYIEPLVDLGKTDAAWRKVADFSDDVSDVEVHGGDLYLLTYKNAPRYTVLRMDARRPDLASAETVVPPSEAVVTAIAAAQDALYVQLLDGGIGRLLRVAYGAKAEVERVPLPFEGGILSLAFDPRLPGVQLTMTSWTKAPKIYAYDPQTKRVTDTGLQPNGPNDDATGVESEEVRVRSHDGTLVPLSIVHPKGVKLDGSNPTHLEGYGAYGNPQTPVFVPLLLSFYERGGVYAVCHVRGGGEYGEEWHLAGKESTKPNTWEDFIACAQYLIDQKYTSPAHLSGYGVSAGGILIGRAVTERPDLFGSAIIVVGCLDMLRQETTANGAGNIPEFGSTKSKAGFDALYAMSAYAHVRDRTPYPAVLLLTGINDPRVDPWQPAKMAARLQAATSSGKPILLRVDYGGGHGGGSGEEQALEQVTDMISFDLWQLGVPDFQPPRP
ncbi:MAG TPA: prolyl oligopeptidase family serine peptidase [Terriglobia bacterium]